MNEDLRPLSQVEIKERLKYFPAWKYANNKISKEFEFSSFSEAVEFVGKLAPFCNEVDHHPDIHIYYKKIVFDLQRFDIGGKVTEKDFIIAEEIERLYNAPKSIV